MANDLTNQVKVLIGIAPKGWNAQRVIKTLTRDPHQTRISLDPIYLTHPRTGKTKVLAEFIEDLIGDSRFAVEAEDGLVFVSRVTGPTAGVLFIARAVTNKSDPTNKIISLDKRK